MPCATANNPMTTGGRSALFDVSAVPELANVAVGRFVKYILRRNQIVMGPFIVPPSSREDLTSGGHDLSAWTLPKVADN